MGDAFAVAAMRVRNFSPDDFARFHPGGALGKRLNSLVRDAMRTRDLPLVRPDTSMQEALLAMTRGRCGLVVATDAARAPLGIITDGDLRRALQRDPKLLTEKVADVMTASPVTIREDASLYDAEQRMHRLRIKALVVVDAEQHMVGLLEIFDDRAVDD